MQYETYLGYDGVYAASSCYESQMGACEYNVIIQITDLSLSFEEQIDRLFLAYISIRNDHFGSALPVFERYFLSDYANQFDILNRRISFLKADHAVSVIQQAPLNGTKLAIWAYLQTDVMCSRTDSSLFCVKHGTYQHYWTASNILEDKLSTVEQTQFLFEKLNDSLGRQFCSLAKNCIRTWLFVNNLDKNYNRMVNGRNLAFDRMGLNSRTHYIASTGIAGYIANAEANVMLDAYSVCGLKDEQIKYLYAPANMNRTAEYGVRFERGTAVDYGDRRHVFISGTASIDNQGCVMYPGNISLQTERMLDNVSALLNEAECSWDDVSQILVYLRDPADYTVVSNMFTLRFPYKPWIILLAPVCRTGWLVEMECIAIRERYNLQFDSF